jgi:hypothetical protein
MQSAFICLFQNAKGIEFFPDYLNASYQLQSGCKLRSIAHIPGVDSEENITTQLPNGSHH